jgi:hypothetical protein
MQVSKCFVSLIIPIWVGGGKPAYFYCLKRFAYKTFRKKTVSDVRLLISQYINKYNVHIKNI